jgi:2-C-methyl-D-erythritol 2,4-cyclodiphosphate synthase
MGIDAGTGQPAHRQPFRIGHGYDLHRLAPVGHRVPGNSGGIPWGGDGMGRPFILGGVRVDHPTGPVGHSDGDALYHAVTDSLLGALALPDIGQLFPDTDPRHDNEDSSVYVLEAAKRVRDAGYRVLNIDCTVILERPKLSPIKDDVRRNIARLLGVALEQVNVKGKTHERVDAVGEGRAIEVHVVVILAAV